MTLPLPTSPRVIFRTLTLADAPVLQALFERCSEFYVLSEGGPPSATHAIDELTARPPGKPDAEPFFWGLEQDGDLVGFITLARDYPKPDEWWLGFLVLDPRVRGGGLGVEVHDAMCEWAKANGAKVMWLGVLVQNTVGERFWRARGYVERERQQWTAPSGFTSTMIMMSKALP